ncbi:MAG: SGNH/GDSL hydrolase family protein [Phycisphaerales bacterium]|nr:MAG: SGNH/GDSL hydrolase family protein [Phycisphaerales bacterium]
MLRSGAFVYPADYLLWWVLFLSLVVHTWCFFKFFPRSSRPKLGLVIGNSLVLLCMLSALALAGESYFRFLCVETDSFGMSLPARRWLVLHTNLNSFGCRDAEWSIEEPPGVRRIAFVGDSFVYGWGIEKTEDRFPDRIQAAFEQDAPGSVEVMNVAKPGWGTEAQSGPIEEIITRFSVDEIVLCYVPNDIESLITTTSAFDPTRPPSMDFFDPDRSCLVEYLYWSLYAPRLRTARGYHDWLAEGYRDESTWLRQRQRLADIVSLCRSHDVLLRAVLLPFIQTAGKKYQPKRVHAMLREFFESKGVPVVDLLPACAGYMPAELTVNARDPHANERAHKLFADAVLRAFYAGEDN